MFCSGLFSLISTVVDVRKLFWLRTEIKKEIVFSSHSQKNMTIKPLTLNNSIFYH